MLFSSLVFLWFFLPSAMALYCLVPGRNGKNAALLIASLFFYGWGEPKYIFLVVLTILINYAAGLLLSACGDDMGKRRMVVFLTIFISLGILGYFKYFNFLAETANQLTGKRLVPIRNIALPLGISFYTFQSISYVADVYRRKCPAQTNLFHLAFYIFLFPQILSGPIIKYHEIQPQIINRRESLSMQAYGIKRFTYGLAKKLLLADTFGQTVDRMMALPSGQLGTGASWLLILLYTLQIYYDFSGYSDMAIGLGRMFGFRYPENFNYPYLSASITEFWRRWHISLSTWFRDYLYIPLGGNRKGLTRTCINLFIVFLATGLWHGASMNFICWGIYYGIFLLIERLWFSRILEKNPLKALNHLYALTVVIFGWVLFRAENMASALTLVKSMAIPTRGLWNPRIFANNKILFLMAVGILFSGPAQAFMPKLKNSLYNENRIHIIDILIMALLLFLCTIVMVSSTYSSFIYFQF